MPKTNAEKCREYWQRKKVNKVKKVPKSSTERVRKFRARRKALFDEQHNIYIAQNNTSTEQNSENDHLSEQNTANRDTVPNMNSTYSDFERIQQDLNSIESVKVEILDDDFKKSDDKLGAQDKTMRIFFTDDEPNKFLRIGHENGEKWNEFVKKNRNEDTWLPNDHSYICPEHFKVDDINITKAGRSYLKKCAVPYDKMVSSSVISVLSEPAPCTSQQNATRRKRKESLPEAKYIIASVYRYLQTEFENLKSYTGDSCDLSPLANILKRTAIATGVSEETVTTILEEGKSSESIHDSLPSKGALIHDFEDEDVSVDKAEQARKRHLNKQRQSRFRARQRFESPSTSSHEAQAESPVEEESSCGSADDAQHDDGESLIDIEEHAIGTPKVEVEESEDDHSGARRGLWLQIEPLSTRKVPVIHQSLPPTHAEVKQEPVDDEVHESTSAVHHLLCYTDFEVKSEPTDDVYQDMEFSTSSTTQVERRTD